jgi:peroxiredoxin (alkyl hydroperoxide reductase subunit C)
MDKPKDGCVTPAKGPILDQPVAHAEQVEKETKMPLARVGHPAPDFEVSAYVDGGFANIRLSDYRGHWVVLCFYPGDFTFV